MFWRRKKRDEDLERELRSHLDLEAEEQREAGASVEDAGYAARRTFGNTTLVKEELRQLGGWTGVEIFGRDLRFAVRLLRKSPGFTAVAVLSLALGIGANTSVFSVLDAVLLKSLPVSYPEQLRILTWIRRGDDPIGMKDHSGYGMDDDQGRHVDGSFSWPAYENFRSTLPQFSNLVAYAPNEFTVTAGGTSDQAFGQYVSGNYFIGLGAQPLIGRSILPEDDAHAKPAAAVLTYAYWDKRFHLDPGVLGRAILVDRQPVTIVGVMRPAFQGLLPGRAIDLFVPMSMVSQTAIYYSLTQPDVWWVQIFGRLRPGVSERLASTAVQSVLAHQIATYAVSTVPAAKPPAIVLEPGNHGVGLLRSDVTTTLYILATVAAIVLLIACVNLANLLLARYAARAREISIRMSIGASRGRLVRQMLVESLLLAGTGGMTGLLVAKPMLSLLLRFISGSSTLGLDARLDPRSLAFTFAVSILTGLLFGTVPAWRATKADAGLGLKETGTSLAGRRSWLALGRYLVSAQIALSVLLLAGAGLFLRTLLNLAAVDLGFQKDNILTFQTDPGRSGYKSSELGAVYRRLEARLAAIPGVEAVGMSHQALIGGAVSDGPIHLFGSNKDRQTWFLYCSDSFLPTMRIPILVGRDLSKGDFDRQIHSAVVNEAFVRKYLSDVSPIGQIFYEPDWSGGGAKPRRFTIVGVARDAHYSGVRDEVPPTAYLPYPFRPSVVTTMAFAIRTHLAPLSLASAVRRAVGSVDPDLPVAEMRTERDQIDLSLGTERLFATLVSIFGAIAVILAGIGVYGVMAFSVRRRTSEIGIRMALGAQRRDVQWLVLHQSLAMGCLGIVTGVPCALALTGLVRTLLYGVKPNDAISFAGAVIAMTAIAGLAAWIPARRASRVDPIVALRYE